MIATRTGAHPSQQEDINCLWRRNGSVRMRRRQQANDATSMLAGNVGRVAANPVCAHRPKERAET
jgi:hypothetical protein